jgi:hypothetical protein
LPATKRKETTAKETKAEKTMTRPRRKSARPWSVPVTIGDVPEAGRRLDLVADPQTRAAIAKLAGLAALPRLVASFDVTLRGRGGLHVLGSVSATVGQTCVVTLDPVESEIEEPIDLVFTPAALGSEASGQRGDSKVRAPDTRPKPGSSARAAAVSPTGDDGTEVEVTAEDAPEPLIDGRIDLGAIATEFLLLGIDPYPRKPGAVFQPPASADVAAHPFAELAALKKGDRKR